MSVTPMCRRLARARRGIDLPHFLLVLLVAAGAMHIVTKIGEGLHLWP